MSTGQQLSDDLHAYLRMLAGETPRPGQFFDLRWATQAHRMRRRFVSALREHETARLITRLASETDVYVGVALRDGRSNGGKNAIGGSHLLYIECDHPHTRLKLETFAYPPTLEVSSGTPEHLHLYWRLHERAASIQVESANRRLALALDGDPASVDIARVLRPPNSLNYKHDPPRPVSLLVHRQHARYALDTLTSGLPADPRPTEPGRAHPRAPRAGRTRLDRELLAIPAVEYARVLANVSPDGSGKARCPFHDDTEPSLQLYPDGSFYCFGSGCGRGGTIIDFAAASWGLDTRGQDFLELRRRLAVSFRLD